MLSSDVEAGTSRRDLLRIMGGVAAANALGLGAWGALELFLPERAAASWHKSVCRFCGTGCGIQVGMREGQVVDIRGDELAHNQGVICVKGSMNRALPNLPGRLTEPKIRRGGKLVNATWDEALSLVA